MNTEPTPTPRTGLAGAIDTALRFVTRYGYLLFVAAAIGIYHWVFISPIVREKKTLAGQVAILTAENDTLRHDNTLMRELLRPDGAADSTGR